MTAGPSARPVPGLPVRMLAFVALAGALALRAVRRLVRRLRAASTPARQTVEIPRAELQQLVIDCAPLFDGLRVDELPSDVLAVLGRCVEVQQEIRAAEFADVERRLSGGAAAWAQAGPPSPPVVVFEFPPDVGRRCSMCAIDWPPIADYACCPQCGEPTELARGLDPLPETEAQGMRDDHRPEQEAGP